MGDLNADCSYATREKRLAANDELTTNSTYTWLIGDDVDTTVKCSTSCAYDRQVDYFGSWAEEVTGINNDSVRERLSSFQ